MRYIRLCVKGDLTLTSAKNDFTQGSILKKLALFMLPILGALVLQAAYGAVDLLVVGRFGSTSGLSAVSTGSQVLNLVTFVVIQFATAITILIARYLGEKKAGTDRFCDRWRGCDFCGNFHCFIFPDGGFCPSHRCTYAGPCRSCGSDHQLCAHLRKRYFLHRRL